MPRFLSFRPFITSVLFAAVSASTASIAYSASFDFDNLVDEEDEQPKLLTPLIPPSEQPGLGDLMKTAKAALENGEFEVAEKLSRELAGLAPNSPIGWHLLGISLASLDRNNEALKALTVASERYKLSAEPYVIMGEIHLSEGRRFAALEMYRAAAERDPTNWRGQEALATLLEQDGEIEEAIKHYELSLDTAPPQRFYPRLRLAGLYVDEGRASDAVPVMEKLAAENPENFRAITGLGQIQMAAQQPLDAVESFNRAIELKPDSPRLVRLLVNAQRLAGQFDDAEATLLRAREQFSDSAESIYELGTHYGAMRDYDRALATYSEGLAIHPGDPGLLKGTSLVHFRLGNPDAALPFAQKLAQRDGRTADDLQWLAIIQERAGQRDSAVTTYEEAVALDSTAWISANNLAALITESDPERAVEVARMAAEQVPGQTDVQDTLGWALFNSGDLNGAREIYDQITTGDAVKATYLYHLGRVMIAQGDVVDGKKKLQESLDLDPEFAYSSDAEARLAN